MRIWFNRGFSLAPIAAAMRASDPGLEVFISIGQHQPEYEGATTTWIEPEGSELDYLQWVRETIATNEIDILVPTRRRALIVAAKLDCRIELPADGATLGLLDDKYAFATSLVGESYHLESRLIQSSDALAAELATFGDDHSPDATPCIKPRSGINGRGFWRLQPDRPMSHLDNPDQRKIMSQLYVRAIAAAEAAGSFEDLVLMEYLPGPEVSVDILAHDGTLLKIAARTKLGGGVQRIQSDHFLAPIVARLVEKFNLHGIVNAQFRKSNRGDWKLLEINARPAGGIVHSEQVGCGLLADWCAILTGQKHPSQIMQADVDTHIRKTSTIAALAA